VSPPATGDGPRRQLHRIARNRARNRLHLTGKLLSLLLCSSGCASSGTGWGGSVRAHGALRAMLHEGLPDPQLYAVGALEGLAGESTVAQGVACVDHVVLPAGTAVRFPR
jgi:hypothetical protein